jgi:AAA15 family ATPase/GTPase
MISKIYIQNFRCFHANEIGRFRRINLLGGLNNSGKTTLLEALLLALSPSTEQISALKQLRGDDLENRDFPEYTWDSFFFNQDKSKTIEIQVEDETKNTTLLSITCDENAEKISTDFSNGENTSKSVLHAVYKKNEGKQIPLFHLISHKGGILAQTLNFSADLVNANYIPASSKRKASRLALDYQLAEKKGKENLVIDALKIIDINIESIKISLIGGTHLEIKRKGENFIPVSLFGDAINKIINIVLLVINNSNSVLLIDEIENGMHHSVQRDFWRYLFELAIDLNIQIFATTHSLEMLQAFKDVALEKEKLRDELAYFELFKKKTTGAIGYNLHEIDTLSFELANKMAIRGE